MHTIADNRKGRGRWRGRIRRSDDKSINSTISRALEFLKEKRAPCKGFYLISRERVKERRKWEILGSNAAETEEPCGVVQKKRKKRAEATRRVTRFPFCSSALADKETFQLITA
mgnify:CR=1 FL=1